MKKLIGISVIVLLSGFMKAQGTLQFDRAVYVEIYTSNSTITVPSGQVCKITAVLATNNDVYLRTSSSGTARKLKSGAGNDSNTPLWLPSGTYYIYCSYNYGSYSAIYFNIVP